jgi:hypothetical protein
MGKNVSGLSLLLSAAIGFVSSPGSAAAALSIDGGSKGIHNRACHLVVFAILLLISSGASADNAASSQCGPATAVHVSMAPTTGLCTTGTPSTVSGSGIGPWNWSCNGSDGTSVSCFTISGLPVTDDFTSDSTIQPMLWQSFPAKGGSITLGPTSAGVSLGLYVPGGTEDHSVSIPNNSTHIVQKIDNVDFDVETEFTSMVSQPFQGQGLIVQQDGTNFIRFGIYTTGCQAYIYGASIENGASFTFFDEPVENGATIYLRIARIGPNWYFDYSYNHEAWVYDNTRTAVYTYDYDTDGNLYLNTHWEDGRPSLTLYRNLNASSIGLYAENAPIDGSSHAFMADVAYFLNLLQPPAFFQGAPYPPPSALPQINLWYGNNQTFGANGIPQQWINILGNVTSPVGIATLTYSLNGGPEVSLSWGETSDRLVEPGDFDADIDYSLLNPGLNNVVITAKDYQNQTAQQTVTINNVGTHLTSDVGDFTVDFRNVTNATLQNWVQIVDGKWEIGPDNRIRNTQRGYDRAFLIGDINISGSYDVTTEFVLHGYSCAGGVFGVASGWQGHTLDNYGYPMPYQPFIGHPFPAFAVTGTDWYSIQENLAPFYETILKENNTAPAVALETPYMYHYRVTANSDGSNHNSLNIWPKGTAEPAEWMVEADTPAQAGSVLFDAHEFDVSIGPRITFTRRAAP